MGGGRDRGASEMQHGVADYGELTAQLPDETFATGKPPASSRPRHDVTQQRDVVRALPAALRSQHARLAHGYSPLEVLNDFLLSYIFGQISHP